MRDFAIENGLKKTLARLYKKDRVTYEIIMKKAEEILSCKDIHHYKNLRSPLQEFKRVHVRGPFILTFKYISDKVIFYDFDHHNYIYSKNT
jgi:mRNA-degrading endonuclease RelE of RelBE toxin-antitoxin system